MNGEMDELQLTAYALGELDDDDAGRAAVEARLADDAHARTWVDEVRATARLVSDELSRESAPRLTELQHAAIERRLEHGAWADHRREPAGIPLRHNWGLWGSLAASFLIVCSVMAMVLPAIYTLHSGGHPGTAVRPADPAAAPIAANPSGDEPSTQEDPAPEFTGSAAPAFYSPVVAPLPGSGITPAPHGEHGFVAVSDYPLSSFPVHGGSAPEAHRDSWKILRSAVEAGHLPPVDAIRTDEFINAMDYLDAAPPAGETFIASIEAAECPWATSHRLVRVAIRAADATPTTRPTTAPTTAPAIIARDVRILVELNPAEVGSYRLIGYETSALTPEDASGAGSFDASSGDRVQAGQTTTALYELIPPGAAGSALAGPMLASTLKYQKPIMAPTGAGAGEIMTVRLVYRVPDGKELIVREFAGKDPGHTLAAASDNLRLAAAAAELGMVLRASPYRGAATFAGAEALASSAHAADLSGRRAAFVHLVRLAAGR